MKARYFFLLLVFILVASADRAQEKTASEAKQQTDAAAQTAQTPPGPHVFTISPQDAARKNPVRFSEITVERGKKLFLTQCAMCHGEKGDGKGDLAQEMKIQPPDFTKPATLNKRTDGELFAIIDAGSATMPGQEKRMKEKHKWEIVNYLRVQSGKAPGKSTPQELEGDTVPVRERN